MVLLSAFIAGLIFSLGLVVSGMVLPTRVIGFLDIFGQWDPTLAFVMIGGILTHAVTYRWITKRQSPLLASVFAKPGQVVLDKRLLIGAAIFGVGWGLAGYCPGPGLVSLGSGAMSPMIFVGSMVGGIIVFQVFQRLFKKAD